VIRTIQSIKDFGVFREFRWPADLPEFKKYNLLYGWNYSGKTTLSRIFRSFEQKQPHPDFGGAQVQLRTDDGTIHHLSDPHAAPELRVFNSDFVRDNLTFETGTAAPILVLGAEDIAKREDLKAKTAEREAALASKESNWRTRQDKQSAIDRALTNYARDLIKNPLGVPNYDKTRFEPIVIACKSNPEHYLLEEAKLRQVLSIFRSTDKKAALVPKVGRLSSVSQLKAETASLLSTTVAVSNPILRLKENPKIERWVDEGRPLHKEQDTCQFCGQHLPLDLLSRLREHFSAEYEDLIVKLRALSVKIRAAGQEGIGLDHRADFYAEFSERFSGEKNHLDRLLACRQRALFTLADALDERQAKVLTGVDCPSVDDPDIEIALAIEAINQTISEHNSRTAEFDKRRAYAFNQIERHYAASFVQEQKYDEQLQEIRDLDEAIGRHVDQLSDLNGQIHRLEQALSQDSKGAERINELLIAYFSKGDLRIEVSAAKRFQITRGDVVAKNLSEGEETAVAFAYFITRVHDGRLPLAETTVVVDDPVSSGLRQAD
jgi:wobble nucleotide-excising tRNase